MQLVAVAEAVAMAVAGLVRMPAMIIICGDDGGSDSDGGRAE
jgi:hypothetical protein